MNVISKIDHLKYQAYKFREIEDIALMLKKIHLDLEYRPKMDMSGEKKAYGHPRYILHKKLNCHYFNTNGLFITFM